MNDLYKLSKSFLTKSAGKVEDLKSKYPNHIEIIDLFNNEDPSKSKKYLEWMVKQSIQGFSKNDIIPTIKYFDKYNSRFKKRDINQYQELKELENLIKDIEFAKQEVKEEKAGANAPGNIYNSERFSVIRPDDKGSCIAYGKGTKWCITMKNEGYYEQYSLSNTIFYFIIDKEAKPQELMGKIAFAYIRNKDNKILGLEVYNAKDDNIGLEIYDDEMLKSLEEESSPFMDPSIADTLGDEYNKIISAINSNLGSVPKTDLANIKDETDSNKLIYLYEKYKNDVQTLKLLAGNKNLPKEVQLILVNNEDYDIRYNLALNPSVHLEIQKILANDEVISVRMYLAINPSIDLEIQKILVNDKNNDVRERLALNKLIHLEIQKILINDKDNYVRSNLAHNQSIHLEIQKILVNDENYNVRGRLAENPSISLEIQKILVNDEDDIVKYSLAGNPSIYPEIQKILVKDANVDIRRNLAGNKSIKKEIQLILANDENHNVRFWLANNLSIHLEIQKILVNDKNWYVRDYLFSNPSVDPEIKKLIKL